MKKILLSLVVTVLTAGILSAQKPAVVTSNKPGWQKIGTSKVDFKTDKDQFLIIGADRFKSLQVKVKDAPVRIEDLQIYYDGGSKEDVSVRSDFNPNTESRVIDLKNNSAELKKVVFVYKTIPNAKADKAEIELWGLK